MADFSEKTLQAIDPSGLLPAVLLYPASPKEGGLTAVPRAFVTWRDLVHAVACYQKSRDRAAARWWKKAFASHSAHLERLKSVMEIVRPVMETSPTLGFDDACAQLSRQALKRVKAL